MSRRHCRSASHTGVAARWRWAWGLAIALQACSSAPQRPPSMAQAQAVASSERAAQAAQRGDWRQAEQQYRVALQAAVALQDPARKALLILDSSAPADARRWIDQAERDCAAPCALAALLGNLRAHLALAGGDAASAAAQARAASVAAAAAGQAGEQAAALRLQARAAGLQGQHAEAAEALALALQMDQTLGEPDRIALDLTLAGEAEDRRGQAATATRFYQRALAVYSAIGDLANAALLRQRLAGR